MSESYPELKANENFNKLQDQLQRLEEEIAASRRYYNGVVNRYNTKTELFEQYHRRNFDLRENHYLRFRMNLSENVQVKFKERTGKHYEKVDHLYHNGSHDAMILWGQETMCLQMMITYDSNMQTKKFDVDVKVGEDGSYTVTENIKVKFVNRRHGIYRYIPYKGR